MRFFVDTADIAAIRELHELGMVDGVTTNPSLILKSGRDIAEVTREICDMVPGPGSAEVVNMQPPAALIKKGITSLPCIGDGRQSGTSGSPSILNA